MATNSKHLASKATHSKSSVPSQSLNKPYARKSTLVSKSGRRAPPLERQYGTTIPTLHRALANDHTHISTDNNLVGNSGEEEHIGTFYILSLLNPCPMFVEEVQAIWQNPVRANRGKRMEKIQETSNIVTSTNARQPQKRPLPDDLPDNNMAPIKKTRPKPRAIAQSHQVYLMWLGFLF